MIKFATFALFCALVNLATAENGVSLGTEDFISQRQFFSNGAGLGVEVIVRTNETCNGAAYFTADWSKLNNQFQVNFQAFGWPRHLEICYDFDVNTPYNQYPTGCVENGHWRLWFIPKLFDFQITWIYGPDGYLIGNEYDIGGLSELPCGHWNLTGPALQMVCSPDVRATNKGRIDEQFTFAFDDIRDENGRSGTIVGIVRQNAFDPTSYIFHYTDAVDLIKELPVLNFETDVINKVNAGGALNFGLSYEPANKPAYLASRDNLMIAGSAAYSLPPPNGGCRHAGSLPGAQTYANLFDGGSRCGSFQLQRTVLAATYPCPFRVGGYALPDPDC